VASLDSALAWCWDMIVLGTSFEHWPDGDPDALRDLGRQWEELARVIDEAYQDMALDANAVVQGWGGDAGEAFARRWEQFVLSDVDGPSAFIKAAGQYAQSCESTALELEFAQMMAVIIVAVTAAEVLIGLAFAEFGGAAFSAAALAAARASLMVVLRRLSIQMGKEIVEQALKDAAKLAAERAVKGTLRKTGKELARDLAKDFTLGAARSGLRGGLTFAGADAGAQAIQILEGNRDGFDVSRITADFVGGFAAGWAGHVTGAGLKVAGAGGRFLGRRAASPLLSKAASRLVGEELPGLGARAGALPGRLLSRAPDRSWLQSTAAWAGRTGVTVARSSLVGGVVNIPSMAAMSIAQNTLRTGDLSGSWNAYVDKLSWGQLREEFVAGTFGGGFRGGVESAAHPLVSRVAASSPLEGFRESRAVVWEAAAARIEAGREPLLADVTRLRAEAQGYRELQVAALDRVSQLPPGPGRDAALHQAYRYEQFADQADRRAGSALSAANVGTEAAHQAVAKAEHLRTMGKAAGDPATSGVGAERVRAAPASADAVAGTGSRAGSVRAPEPVRPAEPRTVEPRTVEPVAAELRTVEPVAAGPVTAREPAAPSVVAEQVRSEPVSSQPVSVESLRDELLTADLLRSEPVAAEPHAVQSHTDVSIAVDHVRVADVRVADVRAVEAAHTGIGGESRVGSVRVAEATTGGAIRAERPLPGDSLGAQLLGLRASHVAYGRAEATAGISDLALRQARESRAVENVADPLRRGLVEGGTVRDGADAGPPPGGPDGGARPESRIEDLLRRDDGIGGGEVESLALHSMLWHDLATAERSAVTRRLNELLAREDLHAPVRTELTRMREEYRAEGESRLARIAHEQEAARLLDEAARLERSGDSSAAQEAVRASARELAEAGAQRAEAERSLRGAEEALDALPEPRPDRTRAADATATIGTIGAKGTRGAAESRRPGPGPGPMPSDGQGRHVADRSSAVPATGPDQVPEGVDGSSPAHDQGDPAQTGARVRPRNPLDIEAQDHWAADAYTALRGSDADVPEIVRHLADIARHDGTVGFTESEIRQVKDHLFRKEHWLDLYDENFDLVRDRYRRGRFDPDAAIAEAWMRLGSGRHLAQDIVLLEHELAESRVESADSTTTYARAHEVANAQFPWFRDIPRRTGEDIDVWRESYGSPSTLPAGAGDGAGDRVQVRVSRTGPHDGHPQDGSDVHGPGQRGGPRDSDGLRGDRQEVSGGQGLAQGGQRPALTEASVQVERAGGLPQPDSSGRPPAGPGDAADRAAGGSPRPELMLRDATPAELRQLGVGEAAWSDLGYPRGEGLSGAERERYGQALSQTALVSPYEIRYTQRSISPQTSDGIVVGELAARMGADGWQGGPLHGVRWGDGSLTSLDNRRLSAARSAGLDRVPFTVHNPGERLADWPHEWDPARRERNALGVDIRELPDGSWTVGGDVGRAVYEKGRVPETFGEIALFRAAEQRSLLPGQLFGSGLPPAKLDKPPGLRLRVELSPEQHAALGELIGEARRWVQATADDLGAVARAVTERLGLREPVRLVGDEAYRVKGFDSLARKYEDEGLLAGLSVEEFGAGVNDVLRFSWQLPEGREYVSALERVLAEAEARGYAVVEVKNFWQDGNRYYGVNVTLRSPHGGGLIEVQAPTESSWRAGKLTHDLYEVLRRADELPPRRVHAYLHVLEVNRRLGLAQEIPPGLAERWAPVDTSLAKWASKNPEPWADYKAWLVDNGLRFGEVIGEFGLDEADLPVRDGPAGRLGADDVRLLHVVEEGGRGGAAGGDHRDGRQDGRRPGLEPLLEGLAVQPGGGPAVPGRLPEPGPLRSDRPGDGGAGDLGDHGDRAVAGRGHDRLDLPVEGRTPAERGLTPPPHDQAVDRADGDPAAGPHDAGGRAGGGHHGRLPEGGPAEGHPQDGTEAPGAGRAGGSRDPGGDPGDPAPAAGGERLAERGRRPALGDAAHASPGEPRDRPVDAARQSEGQTPGSEHRGEVVSGARVRPRDVLDMEAQDRWASEAYDLFRASDADVADIAAHLAEVERADGRIGLTEAEIAQVKKHVFFDEHLLRAYDLNGEVVGHRFGRYDPDPVMAEGWIRLRDGRALPEDILLLEHELAESRYERAHPGATYAQAHRYANERFDWQNNLPERTGEDLDRWRELDGDPSGVPESPGDGAGGGIRVRLPGEGPAADLRQAEGGLDGGGRSDGPGHPSRDPGDPAPAAGGERLAERGRRPALSGPGEEPIGTGRDAHERGDELEGRVPRQTGGRHEADGPTDEQPVRAGEASSPGDEAGGDWRAKLRNALIPDAAPPPHERAGTGSVPGQGVPPERPSGTVEPPSGMSGLPSGTVEPASGSGPRSVDRLIEAILEPLARDHADVADVVRRLAADEHPLNLTEDLRNPERRDRVTEILVELAEGRTLHGVPLETFLLENPGRGALFTPIPEHVNHTAEGVSRKQAFVDASKESDPARAMGATRDPAERARVVDYARRLREEAEPAALRDVAALTDGLADVRTSARSKAAPALLDKVERMSGGSAGRAPRPEYRLGDVVDGVGARITVPDTAALEEVYARAVSTFGVGDGGRILEIENLYLSPKTHAPEYRLITMIVQAEGPSGRYTYELQLTTHRSSVAADVEHNTLYKPYVEPTPEQARRVTQLMGEAAAADQAETLARYQEPGAGPARGEPPVDGMSRDRPVRLTDVGQRALDDWADQAYAELPPLPGREAALAFVGERWVGKGAEAGLTLDPVETGIVGERFSDVYDASSDITKLLLKACHTVPDARLEGLDHRLKEGESLCRKVAAEVRDRLESDLWPTERDEHDEALAELTRGMWDIARYTVVAEPGDYVRVVESVTAELRARRAEPVEGSWKNFWAKDRGYRGINSTWRDLDSGLEFEVQFHTPDSFEAKSREHPLYKAWRGGGLTGSELEANRAASLDIFRRVHLVDGAAQLPDWALRDIGPGKGPTESHHASPSPDGLTDSAHPGRRDGAHAVAPDGAGTTPHAVTGAGAPSPVGGEGNRPQPVHPAAHVSGVVPAPEVSFTIDQPDLVPHDPQDAASKPKLVYAVPTDAQGQPLPLFDGPPRREQTVQGVLGDCGVVATIGSVTGHRPEVISKMITQNPDGSFTITMHEVERDGALLRYRPTGRVYRITVTPEVPVLEWWTDRAAYMRQDVAGVTWASVLEKAIAGVDAAWTPQRRSQDWTGEQGYRRLNSGSYATDRAELLAQLTGEPAVVRHLDPAPGREAAMEAQLRAELAAGRPVLVEVPAEDPNVHPQGFPHDLIGHHAYEVVAVDQGMVELRNPWNQKHPTPMTVRELLDLVAPFYSTLE
jgi:hypothetical protein